MARILSFGVILIVNEDIRISVRIEQADASALAAMRTLACVLARLAQGLDSSRKTRLSVRHEEESKEKRT